MYEGLVVGSRGAEKITSQEMRDVLGKDTDINIEENIVSFNTDSLIDLCKVTYRGQSIHKSMLLLSKFDADKDIKAVSENLKKSLETLNIPDWADDTQTICVECDRKGEHPFRSIDIVNETTKQILDYYKKIFKSDKKIDYDNPGIRFLVLIFDKRGYLGIDFSGMDLGKRQYKIFNHPEALKGVTGYILSKTAGYDKKKVLLDPFMGSGIIVIESALAASGMPVRYYDKDKLDFTKMSFFREYGEDKFFKEQDSKVDKGLLEIYGYDSQFKYLEATKKNAKLAGIEKVVNMSKADIEWLDTKFDKKSVDVIVTDPPKHGRNRNNKAIDKAYKELFYQAEYILKKNGKIVLLLRDPAYALEHAKTNNFKINDKYVLNQGKENFQVVIFERG